MKLTTPIYGIVLTLFVRRAWPESTDLPLWRLSIFVIVGVWLLEWLWSCIIYVKAFSPIRTLPQPKGGTLFMGQFGRIRKEPSGFPHCEWIDDIPNEGLIYYTSAFNAERIFVTSPKALAEVLTQKSYTFIKPRQIAQSVGQFLGLGILFAEGDEHKRQRKYLSPAFSFRHIKTLYPVFWQKAREIVLAVDAENNTNSKCKLEDQAIEESVRGLNVANIFSRVTLDIIGVAGFGQTFNAVSEPSNELYQTYQRIMRTSRTTRALGLLGMILPMGLLRSLPLQRNSEIAHSSSYIRMTCRRMIEEKRKKQSLGKDTGIDVLSVAMQSGAFTDDELVDQSMNFLAAGHETTATALQWAIYLLCKHPEVQERLREELQSSKLTNVRESFVDISSDDVDNLPYLGAVCSEVLRLWPPVPLTYRIAEQTTSIQGVYIPKGVLIVLSPQAINRSKRFWGEDAQAFNPDRWLGKGRSHSGGSDSNYAFMTFLHGPRSCIGSSFARAEFACILAAWVSSFHTRLADPDKEVEIHSGITQRPKGGIHVTLNRT